jgi:hypothetical protein
MTGGRTEADLPTIPIPVQDDINAVPDSDGCSDSEAHLRVKVDEASETIV